MKDLVQIVPVFSDGFWEWAHEKLTYQVHPEIWNAGDVVQAVTDEPPDTNLRMDIRPMDIIQADVKIRHNRFSEKKSLQIVALRRAFRPEEMLEQAETFLQHAVQKVGCFQVTLSTSDDGLNGSLELHNGISKERGGIDNALSISACVHLGPSPGQNGIGYRIENEGGNSEPIIPSFLGAVCRALEIFYSWQLSDALQTFEKETE